MRMFSLGLLAGIMLAFEVTRLPSPVWLLALLPAVPFLFHRRAVVRLPAAVLVGMLWAWGYAHVLLSPGLNPSLEGVDLVLDGRVVGLVEARSHSIRFLFEPVNAPPGIPDRLRLNWYRTEARPVPGELWRFTLRLKRPNGFQNPGGFDYEGWLFQQHVGATGYVRNRGEARRLDPGICTLDCVRTHLRARLVEQAAELPHFGVLLALAMGDRSQIDARTWETLLSTGTNHLVAISGLHIGFVGGLVFFALRRLVSTVPALCHRAPATRWAAAGGLVAACIYAALAGFTVPTQRALLMLAVPFGAILLGRQVRASNGLAVALAVVLLIDPAAVLSGGFWLSFTAVALLLFGFAGRLGQARQILGWTRAQYLLGLGLVPLTTLWFQRAAIAAPLANLVAVPWVSLGIVPLVLLGALVSVFHGPLGAVLFQLASWLFTPLWWLLEALAARPELVWIRAAPGPVPFVLAALGITWLLLPRGVPGRLLGLFCCLPLLLPVSSRPVPGAAEVALLDVGQGLAAVVTTANHVLLFDAGPRFSPEFDTGEAVVVPFLRGRGIDRIDTFIVSHGDNDHIGGAASVLSALRVERLLASDPVHGDLAGGARPCAAGQAWVWDGVTFEVLNPAQAYRGSENNGSCVLRVQAGDQAVLFSGDIEAEAEWALVHRYGARLQSEVLVVPHHGSATSSTDFFLDAVRPEVALVSRGYRNRFGFPKAEVMERYRSRGVKLLDTAQGGALIFMLTTEGWGPVSAYRETHLHLWNRKPAL